MYRIDHSNENIETYLKTYIEIIREVLNVDAKSLLEFENIYYNQSNTKGYICDELIENLSQFFINIISQMVNSHVEIVKNAKIAKRDTNLSEMREIEALEIQIDTNNLSLTNEQNDAFKGSQVSSQ